MSDNFTETILYRETFLLNNKLLFVTRSTSLVQGEVSFSFCREAASRRRRWRELEREVWSLSRRSASGSLSSKSSLSKNLAILPFERDFSFWSNNRSYYLTCFLTLNFDCHRCIKGLHFLAASMSQSAGQTPKLLVTCKYKACV